MNDLSELMSMVFSGLAPLIVEDAADEGELILCVPRIPSTALTSRVASQSAGRDDHRSCACGSSSS
jgi:hypothetical protein